MQSSACKLLLGRSATAHFLATSRVRDRGFVMTATNSSIRLQGPNVVVKGPPYLPYVSGNSICNDWPKSADSIAGTLFCTEFPTLCHSCSTFNQADVDHIKSEGWNMIRLSVVWAGAQPRDEESLDPNFLDRLHAILDLTDKNGINVLLDNHGDMVGTAGCGNGVPMWVQQKAAPELIGKPLRTDLIVPWLIGTLVPSAGVRVEELEGYDTCGSNASAWAQHAGDPNYNLLSPCCKAMNSHNPLALGFSSISQRTMNYILRPGAGRDAFVRFWRLVAQAVARHPSAFGAELMNEPASIHRRYMFETWRAAAEAIHATVPDMSVAVADTLNAYILPWWYTDLSPEHSMFGISASTRQWLRESDYLFYAWHYAESASEMHNMQAISDKWHMPSFGTETGCDSWPLAFSMNISMSYWHYSSYCNTGPWFGNRKVPEETFGACILGWGSGDSAPGNCTNAAADTAVTGVEPSWRPPANVSVEWLERLESAAARSFAQGA